MEIKLSHAGPVGLFTPSVSCFVQRFPISFMETSVGHCGVVSLMVSLFWIPVCLREADEFRGTIDFLVRDTLNLPTRTPLSTPIYHCILNCIIIYIHIYIYIYMTKFNLWCPLHSFCSLSLGQNINWFSL